MNLRRHHLLLGRDWHRLHRVGLEGLGLHDRALESVVCYLRPVANFLLLFLPNPSLLRSIVNCGQFLLARHGGEPRLLRNVGALAALRPVFVVYEISRTVQTSGQFILEKALRADRLQLVETLLPVVDRKVVACALRVHLLAWVQIDRVRKARLLVNHLRQWSDLIALHRLYRLRILHLHEIGHRFHLVLWVQILLLHLLEHGKHLCHLLHLVWVLGRRNHRWQCCRGRLGLPLRHVAHRIKAWVKSIQLIVHV